ncbi:MAG: type II toxin-antitoxin system VapC family toxin [Euryarchaeota archaeon]|nr:type II toxin-antitoxin system VapC family toxin [Euryarchaeota archaeon]
MIIDSSALLLAVGPPDSHAGERLSAILTRVMRVRGLAAPAVLPFEVGHVVHRKRRQHFGTSMAERQALVGRLVGPVEMVPMDADLARATGYLSESSGISFYDASYLAEAKRRGAGLITADTGLGAHAKHAGVLTYVLPGDLDALDAATAS